MKRWLSLFFFFICGCAPMLGQRFDIRNDRLTADQDQKLKGQLASKPVILYHGGAVMIAPKDLYVVYYGSFSTTQHEILDTFLQNLGGSPAYNVNSEYYNNQQKFIENVLNYSPLTDSYNDAYSLGKKLSGNFDTTIIHNAIAGGHLPADTNGIYILTISPDVTLPNSVWCAYHSNSSSIVAGEDIKYTLAADPPPSLYSACSGNVANYHDKTSPNGDIGMDEVADSLMHELSETATDPDGTAWFTKQGAENGDLCNFIYGKTFLAANGSHANHTFGNRDYLVQEIWDRVGAFCAASH